MIAAGPPPKRPPHMLLLSGVFAIRRVPNPSLAILAVLLAGSIAGCDREKQADGQAGQGQANVSAGQAKDSGVDHFQHRSEEHTSELQSLMLISYAVFCLKKKKT